MFDQKPNSKKKAIASLILGVVSISPVIIILFILLFSYTAKPFYWKYEGLIQTFVGMGLMFVFLPLALAGGLIGLVLGKIGLKSTKKNFAITGIVLCVIGLLISVFLLISAFFL